LTNRRQTEHESNSCTTQIKSCCQNLQYTNEDGITSSLETLNITQCQPHCLSDFIQGSQEQERMIEC
jgi:hypothetical protein